MPLTDEAMRELFSKRLSELLQTKNINQNELAKIVGVSESTVGKWILKKSLPRMGIIQKLADFFEVGKSYFLESNNLASQQGWYQNPEVAQMAEDLRTNPNGRILFDASRNLKKEDIDFVVNMINELKKKEGIED